MVQISKTVIDLEHVDFSIIPSLKCNLSCSFCMYCSSLENNITLDADNTQRFLDTVDWKKVPHFGFYGGEPSINMELYEIFISMIPTYIPKFIITNGAWTSNIETMNKFLDFCVDRFSIVISGTHEHRKHQNLKVIDHFKTLDGIIVKLNDEFHPMGRNIRRHWECNRKCTWHKQPIRLGIFPTGDIILQNCDGVYPVVGHVLKDNFNSVFSLAVKYRRNGCPCGSVRNINTVLKENGLIGKG